MSDRAPDEAVGGWLSGRLLVALLLELTAAGLLLFVLAGMATAPVVAGDGPHYAMPGWNLADHGQFSPSAGAPFLPELFRSPGYPAFIAAVYGPTGSMGVAVRAAQLLMVGLTSVVAAEIARRLLGTRVALVTALLCAGYLPLLYFTTLHLTEVLATLLSTVAVLTMVRAGSSSAVRSHLRWCAAGTACCAVLTLVRPNSATSILGVGLAALLWRGHARSARVMTAIAAGVGFLLLLAPWTVRNHALSGQLMPLGASSGLSLYGSASQYEGTLHTPLTPDDFRRVNAEIEDRIERLSDPLPDPLSGTDFARMMAEFDRSYRDDGFEIAGRLGVVDVAGSIPDRLVALWGSGATVAHEFADLQRTLRTTADVQRLLYLGLTAAGIWMSRRRLVSLWPLYFSAAMLSVSHLVFHVEARYTMPARPLLFVLAAVPVAAAGERWLGSRGGATGGS